MLTRLRLAIAAQLTYLITAHLVPTRVGPLMRLIFRLPILFHRLGLHLLNPRWILILGTTGRRTGKQRLTALEYGFDAHRQCYFLMRGWRGQADWYRNACAHPQVRLWVGKRCLEGCAQAASPEEVAQEMENILRISPKAVRTWSAHSGVPYDGTHASLLRMAQAFPSLLVFTGLPGAGSPALPPVAGEN